MPYYRVMVHGEGIHLPSAEGNSPPIVGFYTTRIAKAPTERQAETLACTQVKSEWTRGEYAKENIGAEPSLNIEAISRSGIFDAFLFRDTGYTFYTAEK